MQQRHINNEFKVWTRKYRNYHKVNSYYLLIAYYVPAVDLNTFHRLLNGSLQKLMR